MKKTWKKRFICFIWKKLKNVLNYPVKRSSARMYSRSTAVSIKTIVKAFQPLVELAIKKISTSAEKLLCVVKSYEYRYRAQDKPSQTQRRNRSILEGSRRMEWRLTHQGFGLYKLFTRSVW
jgi:hypothetical protein